MATGVWGWLQINDHGYILSNQTFRFLDPIENDNKLALKTLLWNLFRIILGKLVLLVFWEELKAHHISLMFFTLQGVSNVRVR